MQAIVTKYLSPTNFREARIKATCDAMSITLSWDHASSAEQNADATALALVYKLGWNAVDRAHIRQNAAMYRGGLPGGSGYVYVFPVDWARVEIVSGEDKRAKGETSHV